MKELLVILTLLVSFTSCIKDMNKDCPGYMCFTFLYDESTSGYDDQIGNDVHLRIYQDNVLYDSSVISYDQIKGGRTVRIKKEVTGEIDIVAWAVPSFEENVADIPDVSEDRERTGELLVMKTSTRNGMHEPAGHLYLGTYTHDETNLQTETTYPISMNSCIAQFTATIHNVPEFYTPGQEEEIWIVVHGTKAEMDVDFTPKGDDAAVVAEFTEVLAPGVIKTKNQGLLPSDEGQYISIDAYKDEEYHGSIKTDLVARPGDVIHLDIYRHTVTVYINDWRVFDVPVDWI